MFVSVLDDSEFDFKDHLYGVAKVPLSSLTFTNSIDGEFELKDEFGFHRGTISVSLEWLRPYSLEIGPVIFVNLDCGFNGNFE